MFSVFFVFGFVCLVYLGLFAWLSLLPVELFVCVCFVCLVCILASWLSFVTCLRVFG